MKSWIRRARGALGLAVTWALGWVPVGAIFGVTMGLLVSDPTGVLAGVAAWAMLFGALGFVGGGLFSIVLSVTEGRRRFDQLALPRVTAWGAAGGFLLGVLALMAEGGFSPAVDFLVATGTTLLGSASAASTLVIARRAEAEALRTAGEDVAEVGLTEDDRRALLSAPR